MSGVQPLDFTAARHLLEQAIINLRDCIDIREVMAASDFVDPEKFDELSSHIWDTKVEIAHQIREFGEPRGAAMLTNFFRRLIGSMPNADGVIP
ncbi:D-isomer specific 2-hydroxyacid dehydrogenase NAD-binding [Penicillium concentricum]|uniref:D-isomer specific 2-hydroxyacid dehydrogenase NAD-binding n=1 Tax=Penicillium concentricum TaxID=293559 RepID=A0A9W9S4I9_9EURO|nr:D-isomer specific 2-hydroxyacid dehydrogenase NAD-binding [Penicillium concentricum]KAJ5371928.1 D-isomer specific 2-hydroxyacid dehydrogenase NAD-binding [Penicillium concentricum]